MKIFNRKQKPTSPNALAEPTINRIAILQSEAANWLNNRTRQFSRKQQLWFLFITCLVLGGGSLYLLLKVFI